MSATISQNVLDLLYLCGRALADEKPEAARVQAMNLSEVHSLAENQSLSALAWYGLESAEVSGSISKPLADTWRSERDQSIRRQMLFDAERAQIFKWMRDNGVWHAPLKGAVLVGWYPRVGMREFSDNDIFYDGSRREDLARFFKQRGYHVNADDHLETIDDSFTKEPVYNFEMHRRLFAGYAGLSIARYFDNLPDRLVCEDASPYSLRLSNEDFYLYLIAHAYKHHESSGTGVRILCDLRVFLQHKGENLDRGYVEQKFDELGIGDFGRSLERLADCVFERDFDSAALRDEDLETLCALTSYGIYGTLYHRVELGLARTKEHGATTGGYIFRRIVPDDDWWELNFPFGLKHRWARGPLLLFRTARAAMAPQRRKRIAAELRVLMRKGKDHTE